MKFIQRNALLILIIFHVVGLIGISLIDRSFFAALTPLNLLLSSFLMFSVHQPGGKRLAQLFIFCFVSGYLVELLGTRSGFPFGEYYYGPALGPSLAGVPLIIGINWFLMVMATGFVVRKLVRVRWAQLLLAATLMTLVDLAIEPVAPQLDYWYWLAGEAPWVNYLGWFVVSLIMQLVFQITVKKQLNPLAIPYFLIVGAFFLILNFTL